MNKNCIIEPGGYGVGDSTGLNKSIYNPFTMIHSWWYGCDGRFEDERPITNNPFVTTQPTAPRSVAEMTSGLWNPDDALRITQESINSKMKDFKDLGVFSLVNPLNTGDSNKSGEPMFYEKPFFWVGVAAFLWWRSER